MFIDIIIKTLKALYPDAVCALNYEFDWQLLVACRLSAQCTDLRVNLVTPVLFERYTTLQSLASADTAEIGEIIKPCGLYKTKAASLKAAAEKLITDFGGKVPDTMGQLLTLPGVGRKSANLLLGDIFGKPSYVVDTHCIRISRRLRLTAETDPEKIEQDLRKIIPPEESGDFCHRIVLFGRDVCKARNPHCANCPLMAELNKNNGKFICAKE
jgi:endonuclease-3